MRRRDNEPNSGELMFDRSSLFKKALTACGELRLLHPGNLALRSVISQLHYLIELDAGRNKDRSRLDTIVIGVLARREIAFLDAKTAALLETVADEARKMETAASKASPVSERKAPAVTPAPRRAPADALDEAATPRPAPAPAASPKTASFRVGTLSGGDVRLRQRRDGRGNPFKFAYLQCRMYHRIGLVRLLRMEGYDDIQARSIVDNHPSGLFRMTDDDLAFEQRKAQRHAEKQARKPLNPA